MQTMKLSELVLNMTPELYELLTEVELNSDIIIQGELALLSKEDINMIIVEAMVFHSQSPLQ
ncbi:hypothetical protein [Hazenella coriacea]|uniref:Uncharacterized protein n=1 Tax=Hazenella coriacea TaxID=1179467 RepID=A0A4V2UVA8_9BACL|nr:hypothetical protein [Hazenella coriacea]TCS95087.1 hypothetical protein EDD58_103513 [Hazenella coriacea]